MNTLVQNFWKELSAELPKETADSELLRICRLQKKRLDDEGLELCLTAEPRGYFPEGKEIAHWEDKHYRTALFMNSAVYHRTFYLKGQLRPIRKFSDRYILYSDVTECRDYTASSKEPYVCPNCGAVSSLGELQTEGCRFCGTRFAMSELYPKVSGFYAVRDIGETKEEAEQEWIQYTAPLIVIAAAVSLVRSWLAFDPEQIAYSVISGIFYVIGAVLLAFAAGYLIWAAQKLIRLFSAAGKGIPKLSSLASPEVFTQQMKQYSEEFSYEYFTDKVISILKTIIYSSGEETLRFNHVVESSFTGALTLKSFSIDRNIASVQVDAFMENFYYENGRIRKKEEKIPLTLQKDLSADLNYHFHIRAVKCPACGGSFDALSKRSCPYCGVPLDMRKQDWVIVRLGGSLLQ